MMPSGNYHFLDKSLMTHYCGQCNGPFNLLILEIIFYLWQFILQEIFIVESLCTIQRGQL